MENMESFFRKFDNWIWKIYLSQEATDDDNTKEIIVCNIIFNYNYLLNILDFHKISKVQN